MIRVDEEALVAWGEAVGRTVRPPAFFALRGPLGAGKSVLARAVARGAGVTGAMPSPTFNLLFRYEGERATGAGRVTVVHLDLYRLDDPDEVWELGWEELGRGGEIVLVEWADRAGPHLPGDRWEVALGVPDEAGARERLRELELRRVGAPPEIPRPPEERAEAVIVTEEGR